MYLSLGSISPDLSWPDSIAAAMCAVICS